MVKNEFLARQRAEKVAFLEAQRRVVCQLMLDCMVVAMGRKGMRYATIDEIVHKTADAYATYINAFDHNCTEADYLRVNLDREIHAVCDGHMDHVLTFAERYPDVKEIDGLGHWKNSRGG